MWRGTRGNTDRPLTRALCIPLSALTFDFDDPAAVHFHQLRGFAALLAFHPILLMIQLVLLACTRDALCRFPSAFDDHRHSRLLIQGSSSLLT